MASKLFKQALEKVPVDTRIFVGKSMDIVERLQLLMTKKEISQRELAKQLKKSPSEINKWLGGSHNFTLKTLAKLEAILGEEIIVVPLEKEEAAFEPAFDVQIVVRVNQLPLHFHQSIKRSQSEVDSNTESVKFTPFSMPNNNPYLNSPISDFFATTKEKTWIKTDKHGTIKI